MGVRVVRRRRPRAGRSLYRPWSRRLAASGAVAGVELVVEVAVGRHTYLTGLKIPRAIGRDYRVTSLRAGGQEALPAPAEGSTFTEDWQRPPLMLSLPRGSAICVRAVKVTDRAVPFVATLEGMERVGKNDAVGVA